MSEISCMKYDRCIYGDNCPYKKRPMVAFLCFERKPEHRGKKRTESKTDWSKKV